MTGKNTKCPNTCGAVLGKGVDFLPAAVAGLCKRRHDTAQHSRTKLLCVLGTHLIAAHGYQVVLFFVFLLGKSALKANPLISWRSTLAGIMLCWRHCLWDRRHAWVAGGMQIPSWDKRSSLRDIPYSPPWHSSALLRSLQFGLRPNVAYTTRSWCQPNPKHKGFGSDCTDWAIAEPFHTEMPKDGWGAGAHTSFPCQTGTPLSVTGLGPLGVCVQLFVLLTPRKSLTGSLLPWCESNLNSSRHWPFMRHKKNAISSSFDSI